MIVGFGTSTPELLVSTLAAAGGNTAIAVGNIVGSNIANLSLLLGVGAVITPIVVASSTVRREAPITVGAMMVFAWFVRDGLGPLEGLALLGGLAAVMAVILRGTRDGVRDPIGSDLVDLVDVPGHRMSIELARTSGGLLGTLVGAQVLLWGAVEVASGLGLDEGFVGATLVAVGTSLPELTTVVQSARRSETDLLVGNLLGSNLFNALAVGGVVALVGGSTAGEDASVVTAALIAVAVAAIAWLAMRTGRTIRRWEGIALVAAYAAAVPLIA